MKSKSHRRSGSALIEYIAECGIIPSALYMAGVGVSSGEGLAFKEMWPHATVVGFEPNPITIEGLKATWPGFLRQVAVSDKVGKETLYFRHSWKNGSSLFNPNDRRSHQVEVECKTLDSMLEFDGIEHGVLWLDCEGCELKALEGGQKVLKRIAVVNVEMTGRPRSEGWCKPLDVHLLLKDAGFVQTYIHTIRTCRNQFDAVYIRKELMKPDMCACLDSLL